MSKIATVPVTVVSGSKENKTTTVVQLPIAVAGKVSYQAFLHNAIDNIGKAYVSKDGKIAHTYKSLHTVYNRLNDAMAKYYGFTDKNFVYAVYKYATDNGFISSMPAKGGMIIAMPGDIKSGVTSEQSATDTLAKMGLA